MEYSKDKTKVVLLDPSNETYVTEIEKCIAAGKVCIFQNIDEELDPSIEPILNKSIKKVGGRL